MLIFYILVKLGRLQEGLHKFENAKELALSLSDSAAENAISKAIDQLEASMNTGLYFVYVYICLNIWQGVGYALGITL